MNKHIVAEQLRTLGVLPGCVLLVHTSFSNVGPIEGGPDALIDSLLEVLGPEGTLVMPSWQEDEEPYDPASTSVIAHLGVVADAFWRRPGVLRTNHLSAMAAIGRRAAYVTGAPLVLPPHAEDSGVARVYDLDGWVLLLGVDHDANTTIHLGELLGGAPYFQVNEITVVVDGRPQRVFYGENDSCCQRFTEVGAWLRERGCQTEGTVGRGRAILMRSRHVVETVVEHLAEDPCRFLHARGSGCEECDESWVSVVGSARTVLTVD